MLITDRDGAQARGAPRHDRRRTRIVGIGFVDPAPLDGRRLDFTQHGSTTEHRRCHVLSWKDACLEVGVV
jgi:hypothetical protein